MNLEGECRRALEMIGQPRPRLRSPKKERTSFGDDLTPRLRLDLSKALGYSLLPVPCSRPVLRCLVEEGASQRHSAERCRAVVAILLSVSADPAEGQRTHASGGSELELVSIRPY